jgi:outer membrane immunogenic protein
MKQFLLRLAVAASALVPASALAADIDVPPPVDDLRPANYDWSGVYIGAFGAAYAVDGFFNGTCTAATPCATPTYTDPEHDGIGYGGGVLGGYNFQMDQIVFGIEGDWGMSSKVARNLEPGIDTYLQYNTLATARAHGETGRISP